MTTPFSTITRIAAHRGGAAHWPENSRAAFAHAIALGADQIETDIHLSADAQPVIIHDATLERTTHGQGTVQALAWQNLQRIKLQGIEECVPHLSELLHMLTSNSMGLRLELKVNAQNHHYPGLVEIVLQALREQNLLPRTTISSFDWQLLAQVNHLAPQLPLVGLVRKERWASATPQEVMLHARQCGVPEIALHDTQYDSTLRSLAEQHGLKLGLYAVNSQSSMLRAMADQLSAYTTDSPALALALRRAHFGGVHQACA